MPRDLPENLRLLCSYHQSIADVCRKLGVNRSQFNRYLNGQTLPSLRLMRKMCDFFGIEEAEFLMPHGQFRELIRLKPQGVGVEIDKNLIRTTCEQVLSASKSKLDPYVGYYFTYYNSMSNPGRVLKGLSQIYRTPFSVNIKTMEVIGKRERGGFICKYEGGCFMLGDRIFITALETLTKNEAIQIILYPSYTNRVHYLSGIMSGVAAHASRPPTATCVVMQYLGTKLNIRKSMQQCRLFDADDELLPLEVRRMISGQLREGTHLLEAAPN